MQQFWQDRHPPDDGSVRPKHVVLEKQNEIIRCISDGNIRVQSVLQITTRLRCFQTFLHLSTESSISEQ